MELHLSADQQAFIREGIESGRLEKPEDAFEQAMSLWEERERRRMEILVAVQAAEASLARGEGRRIMSREQVIQLAEDVKKRGIARLANENTLR
jgi:Arc/MetJ-type ribon-helix-helix transcriptional regulator